MAKHLRVTVSRVDAALFDGDALSVTVPGAEGEMTVLPEHEALLTPLGAGTVRIETASGREEFQIERGVCEVSRNHATVLL